MQTLEVRFSLFEQITRRDVWSPHSLFYKFSASPPPPNAPPYPFRSPRNLALCETRPFLESSIINSKKFAQLLEVYLEGRVKASEPRNTRKTHTLSLSFFLSLFSLSLSLSPSLPSHTHKCIFSFPRMAAGRDNEEYNPSKKALF
jgi:hypothetical protein